MPLTDIPIRGVAEISALITGQRAVAENIGPRDVAGRGKRRDHAADREVSLMEALTMELKAMGVLVGDPSCRAFRSR